MGIRQHIVSQSKGSRYHSAPVEEKYKGNYYSIYSRIFHIEICASLFELFDIKIHDYRGADALKQSLFLQRTQKKTKCFNTSKFTRVCLVLSVKLYRKYLSSLHCSCWFPLSLVPPLTCFLPVCNTNVRRNALQICPLWAFLPASSSDCIYFLLLAMRATWSENS